MRTLAGHANATVHWGDAMRLDLAAFAPPATAFVANLPYHVAAPLVLDSIGDLPGIERWCVLVQREIGERLTAAPGTPLYGGPSVLSALALAPTGRHAVSRSVFVPVPNVDSILVAFARRPSGPHSRPSGRASSRPCARPSRTGARRSRTRSRWRAGARSRRHRGGLRGRGRRSRGPRGGASAGGVPRPRTGAGMTLAGVKINLSLRVGPKRMDGYHELATVLAALPLGDELELEPARATSVAAPGLPGGDTLVTRALALLAARAGSRLGVARASRQARARRRRDRRGQRRRRCRAAARQRDAPAAAPGGRRCWQSPPRWAPTCRSSSRAHPLRSRAGAASSSSRARCAPRPGSSSPGPA